MDLTTTLGRNELPWQPMRRLGDASLSGFRVPYPGMNKVVQLAKTWIENYRSEQFVRDKALQITRFIGKHPRSGHPDMRNFDAIAKGIHDFIVKEIKYVRDQNDVERLQTPDATLQLKAGDCDDMVILGGALLESVGVPTRIKLIGKETGQFSHIYLEYKSDGQWKSFDPTLALYPGYVYPKHAVKAEKSIPLDAKNRPGLSSGSEFLSGFSDSEFLSDSEFHSDSEFLNDFVLTPNNRTMGSNFVVTEEGELGLDPGALDMNKAADVGSKAIKTFSKVSKLFPGGGKESTADKSKQQIQKELKSMGYTQFSKMSGWKGDEKAKEAAMKTIYQAILSNPNAGSTIAGWLEGGNITPGTIAKVRANFSGQSGPNAQVMNMSSPGKSALNPMLILGGGGLLLTAVLFMATRSKKSKDSK